MERKGKPILDNNRNSKASWKKDAFSFETEVSESHTAAPAKNDFPKDNQSATKSPAAKPKTDSAKYRFDDFDFSQDEDTYRKKPEKSPNTTPALSDYSAPRKKGKAAVILSSIGLVLLIIISFAWTWVDKNITGQLNIVTSDTQSNVVLTDEEQALLDAERDDGSDTDPTDINSIPDDVIVSTNEVDIILIVGCDSRMGGKDASRSDSIMLGVIDRKNQKVKLISILRDIYSSIPGYKKNKFNTAFYYDTMNGNMDLKITRATIEKNLGVKVDDFVAVDFSAFKKLVDLLGGVTMEVSAAEANYMCHDPKYGLFPRYEAGAGTYKMNGAEALNYARMRKIKDTNGDFGRTERQRKLLEQIMTEALASNRSYTELAGIATEILPYITTNISEDRIRGYMFDALNILRYEIVQYTIPIDGTWRYADAQTSTGSMSVVSVNFKFNANELKKFIFEDDMTYANGGKAKGVSVPTIPGATTTTTAGAADTTTAPPTTTTAAPTAAPTTAAAAAE